MDIKIKEYHKSLDHQLLRLFYKSIYHKKKEFEYFRFPTSWIRRYLGEKAIIKIAYRNNKAIASLGLIIYEGTINNKKKKIGFFVDNCIDPEFEEHKLEILDKLLKEVEKEARKKKVTVIFGWDFVKKAESYEKVYRENRYQKIDGFYWYPAGSDLRITFNTSDENKLNLFWQLLFKFNRMNTHWKEMRHVPPYEVQIKEIEEEDFPAVIEFLNKKNRENQFSMLYTEEYLKKIFREKISHGLIAKERGVIEGVLLYFVGAWSGWMFGKPYYNKKHSYFFVYTPFEFVLRDERRTNVATQILFKLMKRTDTYIQKQGYTLFVDCFYKKESWREDALKAVGGEKAEYDFGCLLIKSLTKEPINYGNKIYLPTLFVIAPIPKNHKEAEK